MGRHSGRSDGSSAGAECLREHAAAGAVELGKRRCLSGDVCGKREHTRTSADLALSRGERVRNMRRICLGLCETEGVKVP